MYIFRAWITDKNGNKIYAKDYGKRAFKIWVDDKDKKKAQILKHEGCICQLYSPFVEIFLQKG